MSGKESSPASLFRLYVDYGRYTEATNLLLDYIESVASAVIQLLFFCQFKLLTAIGFLYAQFACLFVLSRIITNVSQSFVDFVHCFSLQTQLICFFQQVKEKRSINQSSLCQIRAINIFSIKHGIDTPKSKHTNTMISKVKTTQIYIIAEEAHNRKSYHSLQIVTLHEFAQSYYSLQIVTLHKFAYSWKTNLLIPIFKQPNQVLWHHP